MRESTDLPDCQITMMTLTRWFMSINRLRGFPNDCHHTPTCSGDSLAHTDHFRMTLCTKSLLPDCQTDLMMTITRWFLSINRLLGFPNDWRYRATCRGDSPANTGHSRMTHTPICFARLNSRYPLHNDSYILTSYLCDINDSKGVGGDKIRLFLRKSQNFDRGNIITLLVRASRARKCDVKNESNVIRI